MNKTDENNPKEKESEQSDTSYVCLDRDALLDKLYQMHEENMMLSEQLNQYKTVVETLEKRLDELNTTQNSKNRKITEILLEVLMEKKKRIQKGCGSKSSKKHNSKHSKHHYHDSKPHSSKHSKNTKHSKKTHTLNV